MARSHNRVANKDVGQSFFEQRWLPTGPFHRFLQHVHCELLKNTALAAISLAQWTKIQPFAPVADKKTAFRNLCGFKNRVWQTVVAANSLALGLKNSLSHPLRTKKQPFAHVEASKIRFAVHFLLPRTIRDKF
jgi:hypothetical protein